ncbi:hypothetical protein [Sphingobium sp. CFD-2]|uniref:hypothetical protein n=1 Tax=Sphingobium sp. CFD-2 TaxID=2878542 RepID=UPI00214C27DF|nr:hypothetical protein [Sphingobium sp. CFD-2]
MIDQTEVQLPLFACLPALEEDELDDAEFRAKDRAWAALVHVYEDRKECDGLNYQILGDRIGRSRKQVQRWLSSSMNMTLRSIGLLAEGMDADLDIQVRKRLACDPRANYVHPSEAARSWVTFHNSAAATNSTVKPCPGIHTAEAAPQVAIISKFSIKSDQP